MHPNYPKIMTDLEFLLRSYSNVTRATVNQFRLEHKQRSNTEYTYTAGDRDVQETLLEHVGMLPVLAVYFHAQIEEKVDLGRALSILAIHDIGELKHGDKNVFIKGEQDELDEQTAAQSILDSRYHDLLEEYKQQETNEAKFAKSVDKIAPDILDVLTDKQVTIDRLKYFAKLEAAEIALAVEAKKSPYMQWSTFFSAFHRDLMAQLKEMFPPETAS